jgi:hypothetical protein
LKLTRNSDNEQQKPEKGLLEQEVQDDLQAAHSQIKRKSQPTPSSRAGDEMVSPATDVGRF